MRKSLPKAGQDWESLDHAMSEMAAGDTDWRRGRVPVGVAWAGDDVYQVSKKAFMKFFTESTSLGPRFYPGVKRMEEEVVEMGLGLLHAPEEGCGNMTTGGSESIFCAIKACRDWTRVNRTDVTKPNIVLPISAHPAFSKASMAMDISVRRVPVGDDLRGDPQTIAAAIDGQTMMIVGSAPSMPYGLIDSIPDLGRLAEERGLWLHVDACGGGYLLPFVKKLGYPVPDFDFLVPGITSISADLHKYGFCPKPASTVFYRNPDYYRYQGYDFSEWPAGRFLSPNITNTRPAGGVAGAWAVMHYLGEQGYLEIAERIMKMTRAYVEGINAIDGLMTWSQPDLAIIFFGSREFDIYAVPERMTARDWGVSLIREPRGIQSTLSLIHEPICEEYLADLSVAVAEVRAGIGDAREMRAIY